jgi:galactokinase
MDRFGEFERHFGAPPSVTAVAPGRVNLIGEHIDYLEGWVLPVAIDRRLVIEAAATGDEGFEFVPVRAGFGETVRVGANEIRPREGKSERWLNYLLGVIAGYRDAGAEIPGFRAVIHADLPAGAGLSASAALETATALVVEALSGITGTVRDRALLCQRAEHRFAGVPCGIMDQLAVGAGKAGHALLLDCRDLSTRSVPLPGDLVILVADTGVKHALSDGKYRQRREQCEAALALLGVDSFRDLELSQVEAGRVRLGETLFRRARHAVSEMKRVHDFVEALVSRDLDTLGRLLREGHESLRDDFEVSCAELDCLVAAAYASGSAMGHVGTRMTGGGFGGSTVSLVRRESAAALREHLESAFADRFGRKPDAFVTSAVDGARLFAVESPPPA